VHALSRLSAGSVFVISGDSFCLVVRSASTRFLGFETFPRDFELIAPGLMKTYLPFSFGNPCKCSHCPLPLVLSAPHSLRRHSLRRPVGTFYLRSGPFRGCDRPALFSRLRSTRPSSLRESGASARGWPERRQVPCLCVPGRRACMGSLKSVVTDCLSLKSVSEKLRRVRDSSISLLKLTCNWNLI
jgi:hypothetical protein